MDSGRIWWFRTEKAEDAQRLSTLVNDTVGERHIVFATEFPFAQ
jgi:hypothetical protein